MMHIEVHALMAEFFLSVAPCTHLQIATALYGGDTTIPQLYLGICSITYENIV